MTPIDLGKSDEPMTVSPDKKRKKRKTYPTVRIKDIGALTKLPIGSKVKLSLEAEVAGQTTETWSGDKQVSTELNLLQITSLSGGGGDSMYCPDCSARGKGPYCTNCGSQMRYLHVSAKA